MPYILKAVRTSAIEVCEALRSVFGVYQESRARNAIERRVCAANNCLSYCGKRRSGCNQRSSI
jgi:hypothetical protein